MYGSLYKPKETANVGPDAVGRHCGSYRDFLKRCRSVIEGAMKDGRSGLKRIAPHLFGWVADARTLRCAWDHLSSKGGHAPGPNGHQYSELTEQEVWSLCRCLARAIRDGTYKPGKERVRWISKGPGRGDRPLVLQDIEDRVVQRAVASIIQPLLEHLFDEHSLGFREGKDRLDALTLAERYAREQQRWVWVAEDVKDAFLNVPLKRLMRVVKKYIINGDLVELIRRLVRGASTPGLRQGGCLSPLLLNLALHAGLDRPWRKEHPEIPLIRVADDLLVLCQDKQEAKEAHAALKALLASAGFAVKVGFDGATRDLKAKQKADWLGFQIGREGDGLAIGVGEKVWQRLEEKLAQCHDGPDSPLRAAEVVRGWLAQLGPCYSHADLDQTCSRISSIAHALAFDEIPGHEELKQQWQRAHARWCKRRQAALKTATSQPTTGEVLK